MTNGLGGRAPVREVDCLVLGAGMVGISTALHLQARGKTVALVDRQPAADGTSYGNAGIIQADGVVPYMLPLDAVRLFKMLLNRRSEAHVHYSALIKMAPWLVRYGLNSFQAGVERGARGNLPLIERCITEHEAFMEAAGCARQMRRTGFLKVFRDTKDLEAGEVDCALQAERYGVRFEAVNPDRLSELEPHLIAGDLVGGIWYTDSISLANPGAVGKAYAALFRERGGHFLTADATTLERRSPASGGTRWAVQTVDGAVQAEHAVVALGPWSAEVLGRRGIRVPLATKRGYHMHFQPKGNATLQRPVLDADNGYVITQMEQGIRLTTGAEFAMRDAKPTPKQLEMVEPRARKLFPLEARAHPEPWLGARPCFPDMLPAIGPVPSQPGLWANFGHHHLGLTLGPVTGRLLAEMLTDEDPFTDPTPYRVERF